MNNPKPLPPTGVRLPPEVKQQLVEKAAANRRSLNGEIVTRLEESLRRDTKAGKAAS